MPFSLLNSAKRLSLLFIAVVALVVLLAGVMSAWAVDNDGRLNVVHHLGGDVLYCVDADRNPAATYADGGILLLSQTGQHLFYIPAAAIDAVPELPETNTIIAEGSGSFGPVTLWRLSNGLFSLTGQDEYGKAYEFQWTSCRPVGEVGFTGSSSGNAAANPFPTPTLLPPEQTEEAG